MKKLLLFGVCAIAILLTACPDKDYNKTVGVYNVSDQGNTPNPVPEPTTMVLLGSGLIGLAVALRKKK